MKILHTADIHIGFENHGKIDPQTGKNFRLLDFEKVLKFTVDYAIKKDVDLFIFSGDGYRNALPTPTEQQIFLRSIQPLCQKNIPIIMVVGNHDNPASTGKTNALQIFGDVFANVHLFTAPEARDIKTKSGKVRILGLPWPMKNHFSTDPQFENLKQNELKDAIFDYYKDIIISESDRAQNECINFPFIGVGHLHVEGAEFTEGSERMPLEGRDPIFPANIFANKAYDYIALGHIHKYQNLNEANNPPVVYSGSIERISFSEWNQTKGFVMLMFESKKLLAYDFIPTPARPFVSIELRLSPEEKIMPAIKKQIDANKIEDAIVRVRVNCSTIEQKNEFDRVEMERLLKASLVTSQILISYNPPDTDKSFVFPETLSIIDSLERFIEASPSLKKSRSQLLEKANIIEKEIQEEKYT